MSIAIRNQRFPDTNHITTKEFFKKSDVNLFIPVQGAKFIGSVLQAIGHQNFDTKNAREQGLKLIGKMYELKLIEVINCEKHYKSFENLKLDHHRKIKLISHIWFIAADFHDIPDLPMFRFRNWYIQALKKQGYTPDSDWETFVSDKIGDLEKWIEENKPKH